MATVSTAPRRGSNTSSTAWASTRCWSWSRKSSAASSTASPPLRSHRDRPSIAAAQARIEALGLSISATSIRAGLVACTGNVGCKFAASDTKRHAEEIARWCESRVALDAPVNIHLTGCHHSCAQHYIGDIGLLACKVQTSEDGDAVEGYHIHVGGGFGPDAAIAPEIYHDVKAEDAPRIVERMLKAYLAHRASPQESFLAFTRRHEAGALRSLIDAE